MVDYADVHSQNNQTVSPIPNEGMPCPSFILAQHSDGQSLLRLRRYTNGSNRLPLQLFFTSIATLACYLHSSGAHAQAATTPPYSQFFTPTVGVTEFYDDNLFRLPTGESPPEFNGKDSQGDRATLTDVGFAFDEPFGQQRLIVNVDIVKNDYRTYSYLDFVGKNGTVDYLWAITPEITGHLLYSRSQSLNSFSEFTTFGRNINTNTTRRADVDWAIAGALHVGGALSQIVQDNTLPVFESENVRINSLEANVNLVSLASNSIGAYGRAANGNYLDIPFDPSAQIDTRFTEHEVGMRASYAVDGQTNFFGQIGYLTRDNEHYFARNFSGLVGTAKWDWQFTGKTSANITASRSLASYLSDQSSYVVTDKLSAGPTWSVTPKVKLNLSLQETIYQFKEPIVPTPSLRDDRVRGIAISAQWSPLREFTLTPSFNYSNRRSNQPDLGFNDNLFTVVAKFNF